MTIIQRVSIYTMYHDPRENSVSLQEANRLGYSYDNGIEVIQQYKVSQTSTGSQIHLQIQELFHWRIWYTRPTPIPVTCSSLTGRPTPPSSS